MALGRAWDLEIKALRAEVVRLNAIVYDLRKANAQCAHADRNKIERLDNENRKLLTLLALASERHTELRAEIERLKMQRHPGAR